MLFRSIFQWQSKGRAAEGVTQFGRALEELDVRLILANSPQAKGRVERFFGTAQDRWVKEMRLAGVRTRAEANALVSKALMPQFNRRFTLKPARGQDAHRALTKEMNLAAILSWQAERVVNNDYTVRFDNRWYQLLKPLPGLRRGKVIMEQRRDGKIAVRYQGHYLSYKLLGERGSATAPAGGVGETPVGLRPPSVPPTPPGGPYRPSEDHPWRKSFLKKR